MSFTFTSPVPLPGLCDLSGKADGGWNHYLPCRVAVPTQPVIHHCASVMDASLIVDSRCVAGLALSGRP